MKVLTVYFSAASSYSCCRSNYNNQNPVLQHLHLQGRREWVRAPAEKCFVRHTRKGGPAKYLVTKSERLAVSSSLTWAWFERCNVYTRQIMILPRKINTCTNQSGSGPPSGSPCPGNLYRLPPPSLLYCSFCICICVCFCHRQKDQVSRPHKHRLSCCEFYSIRFSKWGNSKPSPYHAWCVLRFRMEERPPCIE